MPPRILLVRHGQSTYNAEWRVQGQQDAPLSDLGRQQAERIADRLASYPIERVISSDLSRAHDTATAIVSRHPGLAIEATPLVREMRMGKFEGHLFSKIEETWPDEYVQWREGHLHYTAEGAESLDEQWARMAAALEFVHDRSRGLERDLLVVFHGGVMRTLLAIVLGMSKEQQYRFHFDNTALTIIENTPRGWSLRLYNDTSHLREGSPHP
jgi:broad specificity phosphatase PhoE